MTQQIDAKTGESSAKYFVQIADEFSGFIDYYQGHGHMFEKSPSQGGPVACITLQSFPTNSSTWAEIGEELLEDQTEFFDMTGDNSLDLDIASKALDQFINETYINGEKADSYSSVSKPFSDWEDPSEDSDSPTYLIVLHIYSETVEK